MKSLAEYMMTALIFTVASPCAGQAILEDSQELKIQKAIQYFEQAQEDLNRAERLFQAGSISKLRLRRAEMKLDNATVRVAILKNPEREEELQLLGAKAKASYAAESYRIAQRLHDSQSVSSRDVERAKFSYYYEKLRVKYLQSLNDNDKRNFVRFKMAAAKAELATSEFARVKRLYERGAKSKVEYRRAKTSLEISKLELTEVREQLGATAGVVR